jgi:pimeloyl-ACP methyl ester carboxylesterase
MSNPILLVHGAWHGAWCWAPTVEALCARGCEVTAIDLPLTDLRDDAAELCRALDDTDGDAVLVGHSYGGMVINEAALGRSDVSHLVFLCAFCPDTDENTNDIYGRGQPMALADGMQRHDNHTVTVDPAVAPDAFYADCSPEAIANAVARLRPLGTRCMTTRASGAAWREIASTYVVCTQDKAIHITLQQELAKRARNVVSWDTSHSPFVSRPDLVSALLADLAG